MKSIKSMVDEYAKPHPALETAQDDRFRNRRRLLPGGREHQPGADVHVLDRKGVGGLVVQNGRCGLHWDV